MSPSFRREKALQKKGYALVAGVDEAGRGPLAGPVVAAAVILNKPIKGLNDSKLLSSSKREQLFSVIQSEALAVGVGIVSHKIIDRINIYQATRLAMKKAIQGLGVEPHYILIDGNLKLAIEISQASLVEGDQKSFSIAAASIVAKVTRDRIMLRYHKKNPQYGFDRHKGYGTKLHFERLQEHGPCFIHRRTFSLHKLSS